MQSNHILFIGNLLLASALSLSPAMAASSAAAGAQSSRRQMHSPQAMHTARNMHSKKGMHADTSIYVGPAALAEIQQQLSRKGDNAGSTDGIWGPSTARAVKNFQKSQGLAATGNLDIETIKALGMPGILNGNDNETAAMQKGHEASGQGTRLYISPAELGKVQQTLQAKGLDLGAVDGRWGPKTEKAVRSYQRDNGLMPTGHIDLGILNRLGMNQVVAQLGLHAGKTGIADQMYRQETIEQKQFHGYYATGKQANRMQPKNRVQGQKSNTGTGAPLFAGPDMIRKVQQALGTAGHNPGQINGKWSAATEKALAKYQLAENLTPTGTLTIETLQKLMGKGIRPGAQQINNSMSGGPN